MNICKVFSKVFGIYCLWGLIVVIKIVVWFVLLFFIMISMVWCLIRGNGGGKFLLCFNVVLGVGDILR